jgi:hypothetical protein
MDNSKTDYFRSRLNEFKNGGTIETGKDRPSVDEGLKVINKLFLFLCRIFGFWGAQYFVITKFFVGTEPFGFLESLVIYMGLYAIGNLKLSNTK